MSLEIKKVSQVILEIKNLLEHEFRSVAITGEISNLSLSSSGHWYFTLSDKDASISAALFKMDALRNPLISKLKDGAQVIVLGDINIYPKRGTFQILVKKITLVGVGDLKEKFELLKRKLAAEGLFDIDQKKIIPSLPKRVAIITAERGAALQDFINIYRRRALWMDILILPTLVQGEDAPRAIRASLHRVLKYSQEAEINKKIDLIVFARGGGSLEDLWAFNDEGLAYDIYNSPIPTVSAIGHEVDFTISDFVADLRAETPSAAAEIITHEQTMIKNRMLTIRSRIQNIMAMQMNQFGKRVNENHPKTILNMLLGKISKLQKQLSRFDLEKRLYELTNIYNYSIDLDENIKKIEQKIKERMREYNFKLENAHGIMKALDPKGVLERGYSYLENNDKKVVSSILLFDQEPKERAMTLHFFDGIREIKKNER